MIPLCEVDDPIFASGIIGDGVAILPAGDEIYAPIDGVISVAYKTKHAIGITNEKGVEILIHIGIDTVRLDGKYFETFIQVNDVIKKGQKLIHFNRKMMEKAGYKTIVMVIVTNHKDYIDIHKCSCKEVTRDEGIMEIIT